MLFTFSVSFPDSKIKGITNKEGREESIWMSSSVACGNIRDNLPKIGETANPGNAFKAEIDQMPTNIIRGMEPLPVCIFITT